MNKILRTILAGIAVPCLIASTAAAADTTSDLDSARSTFIEWSNVKSQLSKESAEWEEEKALLADMVSTSQAELEATEARIAELKDSSTEADSKKAETAQQIEAAKATIAALESRTASQEAKALKLLPLIPEPLAKELQPLLQRLPADAEAAKRAQLSQRIQTVVGILSQLEKFQSNINFFSEIKDVGAGASKEVKTLYFGLAAAYYADATAEHAGYGYPTSDGWQWAPAEGEAAAKIAEAIAIHSNDAPPAFVTLPVAIK